MYERRDSRLRVIYDNATESDVLLRSLQRALHRDEAGRRITEPAAGPLFSGETEDDDLASGTVYVLRSKSDHPVVADNRDVLHKIGVTGGSVEKRIANASKDSTFLLADVEVVATYELYNINRSRLENIIHRVFESAKLDIEIKDRFGNPVIPREWFSVPLFIVDEVVDKIREGTIGDFAYDIASAKLVSRDEMTIPGIGPINAMALQAFAPPMESFRRGRDFSAWLGLVPRQHTTGGKPRLGRISKMGQRDLRRLLIIGAMAVVSSAVRRGETNDPWLARMLARKPRMLVAVALANKMARIVWALMTRKETYRGFAPAAA